jgi:hypothetical protein
MGVYMFLLNGKACIEPAILKLSFQEAGSFCWWEKYSANHFRMQCGVDPGEGYLLLNAPDIPHDSFSVPLTIGSVTIPKVAVIRSVELVPTSETASNVGTRLVEVADIRCYLKRTQVKKNYNVIRYFKSDGSAEFDETTMEDLGGGSYTNWTWETLIQDLWDNSLLYLETLNLDDVTFPEVFPNNYYFENWTHRDALGRVLLDLGFTLEPNPSGTWRVIGVSSDSVINSTLQSNSSKIIDANNFNDGNAGKIPAKLIFHFLFPEESPGNKENRTYQYEHTVSAGHSYQSILGNSHDSIICPLAAEYDFTDPTNPVNKLDLDLWASTVANRLIKLLWTDDGPDVTLAGIINLYPSADIGRITWKNTGSNVTGDGTGTITRVEHFFPIPKLPKLERTTVPKQEVVGYPTSNVTPEMATFTISSLELISGVKPQEPLTVNNTYGRSFTTLSRVEANYSYESREWNTPEVGSGSGGGGDSVSLVRFGLTQDKAVGDDLGAAVLLSDTNIPLSEIVLLDRESTRYTGFAEREDPEFGYQHEFRGWGQFAYTVGPFNYYDIITMEGPARWLTGETIGEVIPDATSFQANVFRYWGAYPNHRAPVMTESEGSSGSAAYNFIRIYDDLNIITSVVADGTKYRAIYDEVQNKYILVYIESQVPVEKYGLLVADIPACSWTLDECTHGYAATAVRVFEKETVDDLHKLTYHSTYPVINPLWPEIIKAGTTTNADKPVVARGYLDVWKFGDDQEETVFVLTQLIYPISIVRGTTSTSVSGTGSITVGSLQVLWGRDPEVSTISVANPEGWDGPNPSVVYALQVTDGTWLALYITCP